MRGQTAALSLLHGCFGGPVCLGRPWRASGAGPTEATAGKEDQGVGENRVVGAVIVKCLSKVVLVWGKERVGVVIMRNHSFNIKLGIKHKRHSRYRDKQS